MSDSVTADATHEEYATHLKDRTIAIQQAKMETYLELVGRGLPIPADLRAEMKEQFPGDPVELQEGDILHIKMGIEDMGDGLPPWIPSGEDMAATRGTWLNVVPPGVEVVVSHFGVNPEVIPVRGHDVSIEVTDEAAQFFGLDTSTAGEARAYPFEDGDVLVLGPQVIADPSLGVVNWKGENYVALETLLFRLPPDARAEVERVMQSRVIED